LLDPYNDGDSISSFYFQHLGHNNWLSGPPTFCMFVLVDSHLRVLIDSAFSWALMACLLSVCFKHSAYPLNWLSTLCPSVSCFSAREGGLIGSSELAPSFLGNTFWCRTLFNLRLPDLANLGAADQRYCNQLGQRHQHTCWKQATHRRKHLRITFKWVL
jgi:hypothetical protein